MNGTAAGRTRGETGPNQVRGQGDEGRVCVKATRRPLPDMMSPGLPSILFASSSFSLLEEGGSCAPPQGGELALPGRRPDRLLRGLDDSGTYSRTQNCIGTTQWTGVLSEKRRFVPWDPPCTSESRSTDALTTTPPAGVARPTPSPSRTRYSLPASWGFFIEHRLEGHVDIGPSVVAGIALPRPGHRIGR